jgi:hypothetical protein
MAGGVRLFLCRHYFSWPVAQVGHCSKVSCNANVFALISKEHLVPSHSLSCIPWVVGVPGWGGSSFQKVSHRALRRRPVHADVSESVYTPLVVILRLFDAFHIIIFQTSF